MGDGVGDVCAVKLPSLTEAHGFNSSFESRSILDHEYIENSECDSTDRESSK